MDTLPPPVRDKGEMYRRLSVGEFGNTIRQCFSVEDWLTLSPAEGETWGVRSTVLARDPRCRLYVPTAEVVGYVGQHFPDGGANITEMVDPFAVLRGEVLDTDCGLYLYYVPPGAPLSSPDAHPWRDRFQHHGRTARGLLCAALLDTYLWPSDRDSLRELLERFPGHVIEFSACRKAVGLIPNRNTVIWEVRVADGSYEKWL